MSYAPTPFGQPQRRPIDYGSYAGSPAVASFFNAVYGWMAAGLGLTALVAFWVSTQPGLMRHFIGGPVMWILLIAELVLVGTIAGAVQRISATAATALFLLYAALNGLTLSIIFLAYTHAAIASAFIASAAMFGTMSVFGMLTKTDLTSLGKLLFMALIGLIVASFINFFFASTFLSWIIPYVGVIIFTGLTAYDTQKLRQIAIQTSGDATMSARYSIVGALTLYLDFLNLFLFLLQIMGDRRRD